MRQHAGVKPLLQVSGLKVVFSAHKTDVVAAEDVSFDLFPGEILAIVGESGAGKSTIGGAVTQLLDHPGRVTAGSVRLSGVELIGKSDEEMCRVRGRQIGTIFQNPSVALCPVISIGRQLTWAITQGTRLSRTDARRRAIRLIERVGISRPEERLRQYPHELSGGMKQRIVIAIAIAQNPRVIIADEPTTALDVSVQSEILDLLRDLNRATGSGVILITHNMSVVSEIAHRVGVMRHGRLVEIGDVDAILSKPSDPYTQALIAAVLPVDRRIASFDLKRRSVEPGLEAPPDGASTHANEGSTLLSVERLSVEYPIGNPLFGPSRRLVRAVDEVSFTIAKGEVVGLVGESGSGKSTIARVIVGLTRPSAGQVRYRGQDISHLSTMPKRRAVCLDMQMIFQDPFSSLNPRRTIASQLSEPMLMHRICPRGEVRPRIKALLERVGLDRSAMGKLPHQFSGGQRQRISIARALALRPSLVLCDEPTSALDVSVQAQVLHLLCELRAELGLALLFISHDLAVIRQMCDRTIVLRHGRVCEQGATEDVFERPQVDYTRHLLTVMPKFRSAVADDAGRAAEDGALAFAP